jgi:hypothetical protein
LTSRRPFLGALPAAKESRARCSDSSANRQSHPSTHAQIASAKVNATHSTPDSSVDNAPHKGTAVIFLSLPSRLFEVPIIPSIHPIKPPPFTPAMVPRARRGTGPCIVAGPIREPREKFNMVHTVEYSYTANEKRTGAGERGLGLSVASKRICADLLLLTTASQVAADVGEPRLPSGVLVHPSIHAVSAGISIPEHSKSVTLFCWREGRWQPCLGGSQ